MAAAPIAPKRIVYSGSITILEPDVCNSCRHTISISDLNTAYTIKFTLPDGKGIPVFRLCAECKKSLTVMEPAVNIMLHDGAAASPRLN